jgi:hypothetical protein
MHPAPTNEAIDRRSGSTVAFDEEYLVRQGICRRNRCKHCLCRPIHFRWSVPQTHRPLPTLPRMRGRVGRSGRNGIQGHEGGIHDGIDCWACLDRRGLADRDLRLDLFEQERAVGDSPRARPLLGVADRGLAPASVLQHWHCRGDSGGRPSWSPALWARHRLRIDRARSGPILDRPWIRREPGRPQGSPLHRPSVCKRRDNRRRPTGSCRANVRTWFGGRLYHGRAGSNERSRL